MNNKEILEFWGRVAGIVRRDIDEPNEETDDELRARILDHHMPVGSLARAEYELRDVIHQWGHDCLPITVMLGVNVKIGEPAAPGELMLIVRTETKWERRFRMARAWLAERWRRWR